MNTVVNVAAKKVEVKVEVRGSGEVNRILGWIDFGFTFSSVL